MEDVKQPSEAGMMCTINRDTLFSFTKNTWIRDYGALWHITNNDTCLLDIIDINKLIQRCSGIMQATKKGKFHVNITQVDGTGLVHTLWLMKFCSKAGANLFSLTCKLSQRKTISSDHQNNIVVKSLDCNIILDCQSKIHHSWVARVEFFSRNQWWEGTISYSPLQEKYQ